MDGTSGQGRARGRGRASTQNIRPGGRRPGDNRPPPPQQQQQPRPQQFQQAPLPQQSAWGGVRSPMGQPAPLPGPRPGAPSYQAAGRATSHRAVTRDPPAEIGATGDASRDASRGNMRGKRMMRDILVTRPASCESKRGKSGREVRIQANYFRLVKKPTWTILQYRIDFSPDIEQYHVKRALLREHKDKIGGYLFDGTVLFTTAKLQNEPTEFISKDRAGEPYKITAKFVGIITMKEGQSIQVLNLILRRAMEGLKLQLVGRNFFDALARIDLRDYRIELWPGYTTSIRQHEQDILMCAEIAHKVMRTEKLYDILQQCSQESRNYQDTFKNQVVGMVILTDYNNKTYRIDDVDFSSNPNTKFGMKDGSQVSYVEYYKRKYNIQIRDLKQPLLVSRSTDRRIRAGEGELLMLIPELSRATGLDDKMRSNFELMKAMAQHTRLAPGMRIERLKAFNRRLYQTPESINFLNSWCMTLDQNLVEFPGRVLNCENIVFGNGKRIPAGINADWTKEFRNNSMFTTVNLVRWFIVLPKRSQREATDFVKVLQQAGNGMRMRISDPQYHMLHDDRNSSYVAGIEACCSRDPQMIMVIVPNNNAEKYSSIKKKTCVDRAIPTQVIVHRTIAPRHGNTRGLLSIATKVAIQINCKLMGAAWMVELPLTGLMTIGFDVCHSARDKTKSYGAMVATMDLKTSSRFFSAVSLQNKGAELSADISVNVLKALQEFRNIHGTLPSRILFYRDGVGEGQFHQVAEIECKTIRKQLEGIYKSANIGIEPKFAFVIVSKQINTRYFVNRENPLPGTVVDDVITLPERYDFFLVSQSVRQGTVSPTHYSIVDDNMGLDPDKMQMLAYKMTHLYYNWSGTTRVPAVCQYAHKLAFLVGQSIHQCPSNILDKQLYFL